EKRDIEDAIQKFQYDAQAAKRDSHRAPILLFYFAGHGFNEGGENYLVPSSFSANNVRQAKANSINLQADIVDELATVEPALQIIITDSCRTPLPTSLPNPASAKGSSQLYSGLKEPSKNLPAAPPEVSFGKNRVTFLFSTL